MRLYVIKNARGLYVAAIRVNPSQVTLSDCQACAMRVWWTEAHGIARSISDSVATYRPVQLRPRRKQ
jgi:hypothetical protein